MDKKSKINVRWDEDEKALIALEDLKGGDALHMTDEDYEKWWTHTYFGDSTIIGETGNEA